MRLAWAYFDTSVLLKRYVREDASAQARALLRRHRFLSSAILPVETLSALCRRRTEGDLAKRHFQAILSRVKQDRAYWELLEVSPRVLAHAEELVPETGLRTLDAIHLASALTFQVASGIRIPFVTADAQQREKARLLRMLVTWVG
jgi:predicted nucleic acid-binding protein